VDHDATDNSTTRGARRYNPPSLNRMKQMQSLDGIYHGGSVRSRNFIPCHKPL
jgi:hypothetical protein